MHHFLDNRH